MDWLSLLGAILGIIGIPGSLYAFVQMKRDMEASGPSVPKTAADVRSAMAPAGDRVLIEFDMQKAEMAGTFENAVMRLVNMYPDTEDTRALLKNPRGFLAGNKFKLRFCAEQSVIAIGILILLWTVMVVTISLTQLYAPPGKELGFIGWVGLIPFFVVPGLVCGMWAYRARLAAERYKIRRDATQAYLDYLQAREINVSLEFTQSKRMFDQRDK
jgi:hypothetical protein